MLPIYMCLSGIVATHTGARLAYAYRNKSSYPPLCVLKNAILITLQGKLFLEKSRLINAMLMSYTLIKDLCHEGIYCFRRCLNPLRCDCFFDIRIVR